MQIDLFCLSGQHAAPTATAGSITSATTITTTTCHVGGRATAAEPQPLLTPTRCSSKILPRAASAVPNKISLITASNALVQRKQKKSPSPRTPSPKPLVAIFLAPSWSPAHPIDRLCWPVSTAVPDFAISAAKHQNHTVIPSSAASSILLSFHTI